MTCNVPHPVFSRSLCDRPIGHAGEHSTLVKDKGSKYSTRHNWPNEYFYSEQDKADEAVRAKYARADPDPVASAAAADTARDEFYKRQFADETRRQIAYAASQGFTVEESNGLWRVYRPKVLPIQDRAACLVASCAIEAEAAKVAYALAMLAAGARLPAAADDESEA